MKELKKILSKIDPNKEYSVNQMINNKFFFWIKDISAYRTIVAYDNKTRNELKSKITGTGNGKRYKIKGRNIINFINKYGLGLGFKTLKK